MSNYAIMRFQKYKLGSVTNIERHQKYRERLRNRKHPEREKENHTWQRGEQTMTRTIKKAIKEVATISKLLSRDAFAELVCCKPSMSKIGAAISNTIIPIVYGRLSFVSGSLFSFFPAKY